MNKSTSQFMSPWLIAISAAAIICGVMYFPAVSMAAGVNLIQNASFETSSPSDPTLPDQWSKGGYGTNSTTFSYPVPGFVNNGARIDITSYVNGDAKWIFNDVPVTPGQEYSFQDEYTSSVETALAIVYTDSSGTPSFDTNFVPVPASPGAWQTASVKFTPKPGTVSVSVYHLISSIGSLTVDNYSLVAVPPPLPFDNGFVSLTFDDGVKSQFDNALPLLDAAGMKGTFYIETHANAGFSIPNSSLETANALNSQIPDQWTTSTTGVNDAVYTYPSAGFNNSKAASVDITTYASGTAAWRFSPITVLPDTIYSYMDMYKSSVSTKLVAYVTLSDNSVIIADVVDSSGITLGTSAFMPATSTWSQAQADFYFPPTAKSVVVAHELSSAGSLTVDDVSLGAINFMSAQDVLNLQADGQEIGAHTQTHPDLTTISVADANLQITGSRNDLLNNGISSVTSFNYPYGNQNSTVRQFVQNAGFTSARTVVAGFNGKDADPFALEAQSVNADTTLSQVQNWIDSAVLNKTWLMLVFHDILPDTTNTPFGSTPTMLQNILNYLTINHVSVKKVDQGMEIMTGVTSTPPTSTPPIITPTTTPPTSTPPVNPPTSTPSSTLVISTSTIHLNAGWNMIALAVRPLDASSTITDYTAESFGQLAGADSVTQWVPENQQYNSHIVGSVINNFPINTSSGFFVHVTSTKDVNVSGVTVSQILPPLLPGWNLLGWNGSTETTADSYGLMFGSVDVVSVFSNATQQWLSHVMSVPLNNFLINPGDGVFIHKM